MWLELTSSILSLSGTGQRRVKLDGMPRSWTFWGVKVGWKNSEQGKVGSSSPEVKLGGGVPGWLEDGTKMYRVGGKFDRVDRPRSRAKAKAAREEDEPGEEESEAKLVIEVEVCSV